MMDVQQLEQDKKMYENGYFIQYNHFEWEKQFLQIQFKQCDFGSIQEWEKNSIQKFIEIMKKQHSDCEQGIDKFISFLQNGRKEEIQFDNDELQILENNSDFKSALINFHKAVGFLIDKKMGKNNEQDQFTLYFTQLHPNIKGYLFVMLDDLLSKLNLKDEIQFLEKVLNNGPQIENLSKSAYEKSQTFQYQTYSKQYFTVLIIGAVGTGKSKLAKELLFRLNGQQNNEKFKDGIGIEGVTKKLDRCQFQSINDVYIELIDTPGCGDMDSGLKLVFDELTAKSIKINIILFCMNAQILRLHRQDLCFLSIIQGLFNCQWENFFICLNFMEEIPKEQIKSESIISSFSKRLEIKLTQQNLIIEKEPYQKIEQIKYKIQQSICSENQKAFQLRYLPDFQSIRERLNKYKL